MMSGIGQKFQHNETCQTIDGTTMRLRLSLTDTWLLELFLGLYTLAFGLQIANPFASTFDSAPNTYALLLGFPGGEITFGVGVALIGVLVLAVVIRERRRTRGRVLGSVGVLWLVIAITILLPTRGAAGVVPAIVAIAHWFCWSRLRYRGVP